MTIMDAFDDTSEEVIRASQVVNPFEGFPETVIVTYSRLKFDYLVQHYPCDHIATLNTACAPIRMYRTGDDGVSYAVYLSLIGGPAAAGIMEEVIGLGARRPDRLEPGQRGQRLHPGQRGGDGVGANPTDHGKPGTKRHVMGDRGGLPLASLLTGANRHDSAVFEELLDAIPPIRQPNGRSRKRPASCTPTRPTTSSAAGRR